MNAPMITLAGAHGVFAGVNAEIRLGERLVVGRSRFVDLSAVKTPIALRIGRDKLEKSDGFRRMSRRHFEVYYESADRVVIIDRSRNGVLLDGRRIRLSAALDPGDISEEGCILRFGAGEEFRITARSTADVVG